MANGDEVRAKKFTIDDFIDRSSASEGSLRDYRYELGLIERWIGKPLAQASERDIIALKKKLRGMPSWRTYLTLARMFYKKAKRPDFLEILVIKERAKRLSDDEILTPGEVQRMVDAAPSLRDRAYIACLWDSGVRAHELCALTLKDVKVTESPENGGRKVYIAWFGKTKVRGQEHRGFFIESAQFLEAWLNAHPSPRPDAPLFCAYTGKPLTKKGGLLIVKRAAARAGIQKNVYNHLFRHSRATDLLRRGLREIEVARLLGWADTQMLRRYAHLADVDDYNAALRAQGLAPAAPVDVGKLVFTDESLKPIVPMVAPPGRQVLPPDVDMQVLKSTLQECIASGIDPQQLADVFRIAAQVLQAGAAKHLEAAEKGGNA